MSVYKDDSKVALLLSYYYTEEEKINFLKNRIHIFLRGNKGTLYSRWAIQDALGLIGFENISRVQRALDLLLKDEASNVKETLDKTQVVYPREKQHVW